MCFPTPCVPCAQSEKRAERLEDEKRKDAKRAELLDRQVHEANLKLTRLMCVCFACTAVDE